MPSSYDVIIIGAGPAGLFAAESLSSQGYKIAIFDKGRDILQRICPKESRSGSCHSCRPCNIYAGLGGAGGKSDGKLNFHPRIGGDLFQLTTSPQPYIQKVDFLFTELSGITQCSNQQSQTERLKYLALQQDLEFIIIPQKHIGSDGLVEVMSKFKQRLVDRQVDFYFLTEAEDLIVEENKAVGIKTSKETYQARYLLACPGREGSQWLAEIARRYHLPLTPLPIDIGVRIETLDLITKPLTDIQYDPKILMRYHDTLIRNFCTNPRGFVVTENYGDYHLVNGHAEKNRLSDNCNFAILYQVVLTKPTTDTSDYGFNLARLFNNLGCHKPIIQRLEDLLLERRSTEERLSKSHVKPTLLDVVPGDLTLAMPYKIIKGILEYLRKMDNLIPGIFQGNNTLLYAPEIKFKSRRIQTNEDLETPLSNLFVAGDGAGLSGGIVQAAVTGLLAAEGIAKKERVKL